MSDVCMFGRCGDRGVVELHPLGCKDVVCHYHFQMLSGGRRHPGCYRDGSVMISDRRLPTKDNVVGDRRFFLRSRRWLTTVVV